MKCNSSWTDLPTKLPTANLVPLLYKIPSQQNKNIKVANEILNYEKPICYRGKNIYSWYTGPQTLFPNYEIKEIK